MARGKKETWGIIDRLPSGRYRARYTHLEERYSAPNTFDTKDDARFWLQEIRRAIQRNEWKDPKTVKAEIFNEYARAWIDTQLSKDGEPLRPRTKGEYLRYLDKGLSEFSGERLADITPQRIRAWHSKRIKAGKTAAARETRLLRAVFNTALDDGIVDKNPVDSRLARTEAGLKYRPPTEGELAGILEVFESEAPKLRLIVLLAAYGGLRFSEIRGLRRSDLEKDGERFKIHVTRQVQKLPPRLRDPDGSIWVAGEPKSAEGVRVVTLPAWVSSTVEDHLKTNVARFKQALLFEPLRGEYLTDEVFNRPWNKARDLLGIRGVVREHDLRGFAATYYVRAGATMREVQALLGHGSTDAALAYQHNIGDRAGELADLMPRPVQAVKPVSLDDVREAKG